MGGDVPKQFLALNGIPILVLAIRPFFRIERIRSIAVVLPPEHRRTAERMLHSHFTPARCQRLIFADGGATRQQSVLAGLAALPSETEFVLVHDGARPFVTAAVIERCLAQAIAGGAAAAGVPVKDTIKEVDRNGTVRRTVDRSGLWHAQTPQAAATVLLRRAYENAAATGFEGTDEASLLEHAGIPVQMTEGSEQNIKITRPADLYPGRCHSGETDMARIGHGFDVHRFEPGRKLILGGVTIPHELGLEGHSDADVLTHAFMDALLGALGAGDIGQHFPDSDDRYRGISSLELLGQVMALVKGKEFIVGNGDITVICQRPKLAPHIKAMRAKLAAVCEVDTSRINIKATTTEELGYAGRGEGAAVHAVVMLEKSSTISG